MYLKKLKQSGDTIVEVLIATVIIGAVLAGAYYVTNKSFIAERQSNERGLGLQLAQDQLEAVRSQAINNPASLPTSGTFCLDNMNAPLTPPNCYFNADNTLNSSPGAAVRYHVLVTEPPASATVAANTFTVTVTWNQAGGGTEVVSLVYRVNPLP